MKKQKISGKRRLTQQTSQKRAFHKTSAKNTLNDAAGVRRRLTTKTLNDPPTGYTVSSKLRDIGNSKGVILNNRILEEAGIAPESDLLIHAAEGLIIIEATSKGTVNTNLSTWDAGFKQAIKKGKRQESDLWKGLENKFDQEEWT